MPARGRADHDAVRVVGDAERRARIGVRHALAERVGDTLAATRAVTCLHATEPASVHLSAFARCGATRDDVDTALYADRSVVKQLAMRRTVFVFPRDLLPAVRGSAAARVATQQATRMAKEVVAGGFTTDGQAWLADVAAQVLARLGASPATTQQLRGEIPELERRLPAAERTDDVAVPIAPRVLTVLAAGGAIVRGENNGGWKLSRPRWTLAEQWTGEAAVLPEAAGYAELVGRWLWSFGPGTEADLVWWLGATKAAVRQALDDVGAVPVALTGGEPAWLHPDDTEVVTAPRPWAALLPSLDPTTMGWQARRFYLGPHAGHIFDRNGNGGPTAWWNGRIVGGWRQDDDGTVVVVPVAPLPAAAARALTRRARELTVWLAGDVVKSIYQSPLVRAATAGTVHG